MKSYNPAAEVALTSADIQTMQRWYRGFADNPRASITTNDVVLHARLQTIRTDIEDRVVVRDEAIRHRSDVQRFQHPGVERRNRVAANQARLIPQRIVRPVTVITH